MERYRVANFTRLLGGEIRVYRSAIRRRSEGTRTVSGKDMAKKPIQNSDYIHFAPFWAWHLLSVSAAAGDPLTDGEAKDKVEAEGAELLLPACFCLHLQKQEAKRMAVFRHL